MIRLVKEDHSRAAATIEAMSLSFRGISLRERGWLAVTSKERSDAHV